jgi:predicted phosphodiesterase
LKIAVFSDMHANCIAFDAMLAHLRANPTDLMVCLGDTAQGGPQPHETLARLRDLGCPVVIGNADAWMRTGIDTATAEDPPTEDMKRIREWSLSQLTPDDVAFINTFQPTIEIPLEAGKTLLCFHATPQNFDDVFLPDTPQEEFEQHLAAHLPAIMCGGHTHLQYVRRLGESFFFNPGTVGLSAYHHQPEGVFQCDPWAEYAVLTVNPDGGISLDFRRVPYDMQAQYNLVLNSDMPVREKVAAKFAPRT